MVDGRSQKCPQFVDNCCVKVHIARFLLKRKNPIRTRNSIHVRVHHASLFPRTHALVRKTHQSPFFFLQKMLQFKVVCSYMQHTTVHANKSTKCESKAKIGQLTCVAVCSLSWERGSIRGWRLVDFYSTHFPKVKSIDNQWPNSHSEWFSIPHTKAKATNNPTHRQKKKNP